MKIAVIVLVALLGFVLVSSQGGRVVSAQSDLSAPGNVAAENTGNAGEVRISWDAVPDAAYYRIGWVAYSDVEPIIAAGGDWLEHFAFIDIENRDQTEHTVTRLTPGVQYAFIMASNDGRYGTPRWPPATGWAFLTLNEAPTTHASLGSTAENVTWDAVPGATYYRIGWVVYEDVAPIIAIGGDWLEHFAFIDIANRGQTEHEIARLTPGLQYAFIVAGNDGRYGTPQWPPASAWQFMTPSVVQPTGPDSDRDALIALYNATGGADWSNRTNWLSNSPMGQWYGVTTNDDGKVTELRLLENGLAGPIPGTLGNLSSLNRLNLGDNALTGTIPAELQNLGNLQQFYLWNNRLTGPVPAWLGNLTNLKRLGLSRNRLEGMVPGTLGNLSNLNLINFGGNDLTGPIPTQLRNLGNLEELNLWENRFTGPVPSWLGSLGNLTRISLHGNQLSGQISPTMGNLSALTHLALADNLLSGQIPPELGNLTKLERIHLAGNQLTGCVPESLRHVADNDFLGLILPFCGSSSQPAATEVRRFRDPDVPYLMWEVGPGVPDLHYEYLREGIVHIHRYATPLGLPPLPDDATFYLYADLDLMAQTLARLESWRSLENARQYVADGNWGGLAGLEDEDSGWIMVHLRNVARSGNPSDLPHVAAHELSHVYQYTLQNHGRFDNTHSEVRVIGPAWMQEGFAEFHGMAALAHGGIRPYEQRRQEYLGRALRVDVSLKETETYDGLLAGNGRFDLAALAAELLASQSSERALIRYWTLLGPDTTWQQAFQTAFGMTIDDFYTRFADHRANGYPTVTLP